MSWGGGGGGGSGEEGCNYEIIWRGRKLKKTGRKAEEDGGRKLKKTDHLGYHESWHAL